MRKVIIILVFLLVASVAKADCIRCGLDKLVCTGDSKFDIIVACGQPDYTEELGDKVTGAIGGGAFVASEKKMEKMYYNCGDGRFIKIILISNGRIIRIDDGERGRGPIKCN